MVEESMSKEEKIGYHKGCINTLLSERSEMLKIVQITEQLVQAHAQELEKLGVKLSDNSSSKEPSKGKKKA